jgi:putative DNA primase/helicase
MVIVRDELTGWIRGLEKPDRQTDRAFYLEAWNGNGQRFYCDRIGRGTTVIPHPCVSILGGMQPGPLIKLVRWVARGEEADDGLISRFQLLVWPDPAGAWRNVDEWPDSIAKNRAYAIFKALESLDPSLIGANGDEDGGPPYLRFSPEAQDVFNCWRERLEAKVRAPDLNPLVESHLAKYRSLMPSLALLFHLVDVVDGAPSGPVSVEAARRAVEWCDFLEEHARRVYDCVTTPDLEAPSALAEKIKDGALPSPFTPRDVYRRCWAKLDSREAVHRAVAVLEDHGWLRSVETRETGGAPRVDIYIHPRLPRKAPTGSSQATT